MTYCVTDRRKFGRQDWSTTVLSFGSVPIGNMGRAMSAGEAEGVIEHAWAAGVRLFDTAPMYGHGLAESRLGSGLADVDRGSYALITKVGRRLSAAPLDSFDSAPWVNVPAMKLEYDYSYDGVMRQVEDSLQRMATDRFDVLLVHDTDRWTHGAEQPQRFREALGGAFKALVSLRDEGVVRAIGIGVNEVDVCLAAANAVDIDCMLIAGTHTLLDQEAALELLPLCQSRGIAVVNGRVFGSGILATGSTPGARFDYARAGDEVLSKVRAIEEICQLHDVPLGAAAVQFAAKHPAIVSVCLGARTVVQQQQNYDWFEQEIPDDLWEDLRTANLLAEHR
ncbi:aldo/keto reductase [Nakamurella sp. PAMC28650]|uniref:aldo/keto reductase n=1 Tax=Nakamurella sp. PAMC28650 TaxID=2762325 RepID=UPI00164DFEA5|nr:aldo/keto reductase [Nakamurella sp. PAMC28650]QNK82940.1 aldo/keto reductase [Nakamurella sp. PAMC28650]